ncbi:hypothetical protein MN608_06384 [Microdochium nivale]|nr:hypothetical protein MN608_06384 [Microdochium nivale]
MSWAARRKTTQKEDAAYCLLGIFGVNIPLIYGEGDKAFIRLQEEILRHSFDPTLLAWGELEADDPLKLVPALKFPLLPLEAPDPSKLVSALKFICNLQHPWSHSWRNWRRFELGFVAPSISVLAPNARHFYHCGNLVRSQSCSELSWALTPQGLQINIPVSRWFEFEQHPYLVTPRFPRRHPALLLAVPIIAMGDGSFGRGKGATILVPAHKWHQWPRTNLVLTTRSGTVPVDERQRLSSLRCDVWIRSLPTGFTIMGLPDVDVMSGDDKGTESGILLGAEQAWQVPDTAVLRANLKFFIQPRFESCLAVHVSRGPYHARPVPAYFPKHALWFRATSRRNYSAASITALDGEPPPVESHWYLGNIHRSGPDIFEAANGDLVSVELTEKDIAGRPLLVIDIRQGPSRLGHLWNTSRISLSQTGNSQQAGVTRDRLMARMILATMLRTAIWLYDIFRLLYLVPLIPSHRLDMASRNNLFLSVPTYGSFLLEGFRMSSLRPSLAISVCLYFLAGYNFWQVCKADDFFGIPCLSGKGGSLVGSLATARA